LVATPVVELTRLVYAARITDAANTSSTTSGLLAMTSNSTRAAASG
jgi:hypothetical protein